MSTREPKLYDYEASDAKGSRFRLRPAPKAKLRPGCGGQGFDQDSTSSWSGVLSIDVPKAHGFMSGVVII